MTERPKQVFVYADASFSKPAQLAVLGFVVFESKDQHDQQAATQLSPFLLEVREINNIRAELRGAIWALESCYKDFTGASVVLYTDCQTVIGLLGRRARLEATDFVSKSKKTPLMNTDLYKEFYKIYDLLQPQVVWVRGHVSRSLASKVESNFAVLDKVVRQRLRQKVASYENKNIY
jgi:ribonuclease HI